jgi:hypothetical protein
MVFKISEKVGHLSKVNGILKIITENISAVERPSVSHMQDSLTRREMTSSAAPKNNTVKTFKMLCQLAVSRYAWILQFLLIWCALQPARKERNAANLEEW